MLVFNLSVSVSQCALNMGTKLLLFALGFCATNAAFTDFPGVRNYDRTDAGNLVDKPTLKLLREAYTEAKDKNVITSPVAALLLLMWYGSVLEGESRTEITQVFGSLGEKSYTYSENLINQLTEPSDAFTLRNKMYLSKDYTLTKNFDDASHTFKSTVENVDFQDTKTAVAKINEWAETETRGYIKNVLSEDQVDPSTVTALFNVIFFQGQWHVPFEVSETKEKDFHVDKTSTVKKPMMKLEQTLLFKEDEELGAKIVELPYKQTGFRMIVVLPNEIDGLPKVLEKLEQKGLLDDVFTLGTTTSPIDLELPRFNVESELDLMKIFPKMGVSKIFSGPAKNVVKERDVVVSKAFQKAFVKVDEEGATAGGFTGMLITPLSSNFRPPPPIEFKADHPFLFAILKEDVIIFAGTYTH